VERSGREVADRSDAELVSQIRGGDPESYSALVARYQGHVYGLAYSLVNNWADAQDIAQETFIRAYVNLDQLKDPARFAPWLRRVTFGVAMNWLRAYRPAFYQQIEGQVDLESLEVPDFAPGPQEVVERKELAEAVQRAIESLPPKYRVPLTMFHLDGLSFQKVADFLDIPLGTAKSLLHRAREKLRVALGAYYSEEVLPMVQEVFDEHKLPAGFDQAVVDEITGKWWGGLAPAQAANSAMREAELEVLARMKEQAGAIPKWALQLIKSLPEPEGGFEICSHRWVDGLDNLVEAIGEEQFQPSRAGRCGDVPGRVLAEIELRGETVQGWAAGRPAETDLDKQIAAWLGPPTPAKREAAKCFAKVTQAFVSGGKGQAGAAAQPWRSKAATNPLIQRLFYGEGIIGGFENACGYQIVGRLETLIRIIGGDDSQLEEIRWFCNTQLRFVFRDDPSRMSTTLGYLWGLQAYLLGRDERWLRKQVPQAAGAAIYALRGVVKAGPPTPLRRWLVASLLVATRYWYQRAVNFAGSPESAGQPPDVMSAIQSNKSAA
jgi:RNA polymerase sigma-70 factor (ECF subfamily)